MIEPGSAEWLSIITPSKVAAILGVSRWESPFRLWHRMKGNVPPEPPKDIFNVGHAFEAALAELWKLENPGWQLSPGEVQIRNDFGFPTLATLDRRARRGRARKAVQFKTARKLEEWGDFGSDQAPADYVAAEQWEMHVTGYTKQPAELMVMGPFFEHFTYRIPYEPYLCMTIEQRCREFVDSLQADEPPDLDDSVPSYECVRQLHPEIEDREVQIDPELAAEYLDAARSHKESETRLRGLKTRVLDVLDGGHIALAGTYKVADRRPAKGGNVALYPNPKTSIDDLKDLIA